jgi:hypothetical protein
MTLVHHIWFKTSGDEMRGWDEGWAVEDGMKNGELYSLMRCLLL